MYFAVVLRRSEAEEVLAVQLIGHLRKSRGEVFAETNLRVAAAGLPRDKRQAVVGALRIRSSASIRPRVPPGGPQTETLRLACLLPPEAAVVPGSEAFTGVTRGEAHRPPEYKQRPECPPAA